MTTPIHFRDKKTEARELSKVTGSCQGTEVLLSVCRAELNCLARQKHRKANKKRSLPYVFWKCAIYFLVRNGKMKLLDTQLCLILCEPMKCNHQAPLSMEFSRQEYWSELLFLSLGDLPDPGIEPRSPALQADSLLTEKRG